MNVGTVLPDQVSVLSEEHREAMAHAAALHEVAEAFIADPTEQQAADVGRVIGWFAGPFSRHMAREDAALIPVLETAMGQWCSLPAWMSRDHADLRAAIDGLDDAVRAARVHPGTGGGAVRREVDRLRSLLAIHLHREDHWLMPVARAVLSQGQWDEVARGLGRARA